MAEHECQTHYSGSAAPLISEGPDGFTVEQWHQDATGDSGYGPSPVGRQYVIACSWCRCTFIAPSRDESMELFRAHEREMLGQEQKEAAR